MDFVGPTEMRKILATTDALGLHREAVRIPLTPVPGGSVEIAADKLVLEAPTDVDLDAWLLTVGDQARELTGFRQLRRADP